MRITVERSVPEQVTEQFLPVYRSSFAHLAERSAAKQVLEDGDFRALMGSESSLKFCGWAKKGDLVALALMAHDLSLVPWVSVPYFRRRWPREVNEHRIAYLLTILVHEEHRSEPWMARLIEGLAAYGGLHDTTLVFDCCRFNIEEVPVPEMIATLASRLGEVEQEIIDVQHYYTYRMADPDNLTLSVLQDEGVIDLTNTGFVDVHTIDLRDDRVSHLGVPTTRPGLRQ